MSDITTPDDQQTDDRDTYDWRVSSVLDEDGKSTIELSLGTRMSELPYTDDTKVQLIGRALIQLGTRFMGSSVSEDEDDWGDDDDDE